MASKGYIDRGGALFRQPRCLYSINLQNEKKEKEGRSSLWNPSPYSSIRSESETRRVSVLSVSVSERGNAVEGLRVYTCVCLRDLLCFYTCLVCASVKETP